MKVFVDTGAFVALALARDGRHELAAAIWRRLAHERAILLTTDWVFGETVTFLRRRAGYQVARQVGEALRASAVLEIVNASAEMVDRAWTEFLGQQVPDLSLVDALSFVTMRAGGLQHAFAFDEHFSQAGFEVLR